MRRIYIVSRTIEKRVRHISEPFHLFCCVPVLSLGALKSHRTPHCSVGRCKRLFFSKIAITKYKISNFSFCRHVDPQHPPLSKQEHNFRHSAYRNHSYSSRWLLLPKLIVWTRTVHDIATEIEPQATVQVHCVVHSACVSQK